MHTSILAIAFMIATLTTKSVSEPIMMDPDHYWLPALTFERAKVVEIVGFGQWRFGEAPDTTKLAVAGFGPLQHGTVIGQPVVGSICENFPLLVSEGETYHLNMILVYYQQQLVQVHLDCESARKTMTDLQWSRFCRTMRGWLSQQAGLESDSSEEQGVLTIVRSDSRGNLIGGMFSASRCDIVFERADWVALATQFSASQSTH